MKTKKNRFFKNSLYTIYLKNFLLFSFLVLLLLGLVYLIVLYKIESVRKPVISELLEYKDLLERDAFSEIPLQKFKSSSFIILDNRDRTIYKNNKLIEETIEKEDLDFISEYDSEEFFSVSIMKHINNEKYLISKKSVDEYGIETIEETSFLDKEYNIIYGSLFEDKKTLTKKQFDILSGNLSGKYTIEKYSYINTKGSRRVLVFFSPFVSSSVYNKLIIKSNEIWWVFVPLFIIMLIIVVIYNSKKIKNFLMPLNDAIVSFADGKSQKINEYEGPQEFEEIANNFKELTVKLTKSEDKRKKSDNEKQRMLADISHDLKTPITVIQGYSKMICDGIVKDDERDKYVEIIYNKSLALSELINTFFEYSKTSHPDFKMNTKVADICEYCKEYLSEQYQEFELFGYLLEVNIPDEQLYCDFDTALIRRVLDNLTNNVIKHNPKGTKIYFSIREYNQNIYINVADNGVGISKNIVDNIFDPFIVDDPSRSSKKGTGLGMAIVQKIIENHDGTIKLILPPKSKFSSEFEIQLPLSSK